jgi:hypothetical protein
VLKTLQISNNMDDSGEIFKFNNLTDYEKLLFANSQIKELKQELKESNYKLGELQSEFDYYLNLNIDKASMHSHKQELKNCVNKINHYKAKIKNFDDDSWKTKYNNLFLDYIKLKNNL